ncbi:flagellar biosynthetic protein FliO [Burkholderia cenocepacia]|uniref:Flagellar protein n=1 Tax=Burkholderia cenocepacia (strain ATCC BAA-245 / DSM 16553 / LMG 16656 / NCTC 13227 / J2315 / CF5610) TaxID=216591 RepID=B4E6N4_BURCJ|nr:flagellar biosynthetic protein FliO [Burkholderia cenocepacia]KIS49016.1 flagellar biosynthetic protein FliO [Burkholderia cepacia]EPZ91970.1 flagellar biosynthetic protein FliO [Burkholderia cenocepacia K56-2Valvano]ERI25402.1 flagellar biosynthetic protein FliO [Burkholderia cenocepacia BC7]KKI81786.1 flagellar biosynthesis protein FliO [Burkholderia cenocepacia]MDR8052002.1 flagellar biosynthetic protein FliO [Burkholderia cenocepacia]
MNVVKPGQRVCRAMAATVLAVVASLVCTPAGAADMNAVNHPGSIASSVTVGSAAPSLGIGAVLQTLVGLAVVIGLVFACAWLARRFGFQPARRGGPLKVVSSVGLGAKESATIVEIGDTWLVLGVAPGNVRLLHTLPAASVAATATAGSVPADASAGGHAPDAGLPGTFGSRFRDALAGEAVKRLGRGKDR